MTKDQSFDAEKELFARIDTMLAGYSYEQIYAVLGSLVINLAMELGDDADGACAVADCFCDGVKELVNAKFGAANSTPPVQLDQQRRTH